MCATGAEPSLKQPHTSLVHTLLPTTRWIARAFFP